MTVTLPGSVAWTASGWIVRRFFADAAAHLTEVPGLADEIRDGLESGIHVLTLREASPALLAEAELVVERVVAANLATQGRDFSDPSAFPVYLEKLRELSALLRAASPAPPVASGVRLAATTRFELGHEDAPDSPTGLKRLVVTTDGCFRFQNRRSGEIVAERTGSLVPAAVEEIAGSLATAGFPVVPDHARPPGANYLTISSGDASATVSVSGIRNLPGYGPLVRRVVPWLNYLVRAEGTPPAEIRLDPPAGG